MTTSRQLTMVKERETKNTVRFSEVDGETAPAIGTLYVYKYAVRELGNPDKLVVTIASGN